MDSDWLAMAAGMAADEKRRAEKKAQEEKQQIKGQYDKWCNDHGVPIPPEYVAQSYQQTRNDGSVFLGWTVIGIILFVIFLLIVR
jgi:hypothetical protein